MNVVRSGAIALAMFHAAPAWSQDTGSFSLQVTIPPLGAAQTALDAGAAGSWTVLTPGGGLMIAAPASGEGLTIFRSDSNRFSLFSGDGRLLKPDALTRNRELTALHFGTTGLPDNERERQRFVISGL